MPWANRFILHFRGVIRGLIVAVLLSTLLCVATQAEDGNATKSPLDRAFQHAYNLNFTVAREEIAAYKAEHPQDPLGHVSEAAVLLFAEFDRLQVLQSEFFTDDDEY